MAGKYQRLVKDTLPYPKITLAAMGISNMKPTNKVLDALLYVVKVRNLCKN